jgi:signal peptidase
MKEVSRMKMRESGPLDRIGAWVEAAGAWWWAPVVGWAVAIYMIIHFALPGAVSPGLSMYVIQPLLWFSLAFLAFLGWRYGLKERPSFSRPLVVMAILFGACQVAVFVIAGLFLDFGRSPYSHRPLAVLGNLLYLGTVLAGTEMSRAYLVALFRQHRPLQALGLVNQCLFFSVLNIPFGRFEGLQSPLSAFQTVGETFLPTVSENLLATFLALLGGPVASIAYRGTLKAFEWLSPILPDLQWMVTAFLGTLVPAFGLMVIYNRFLAELASEGKARPQEGQSTTAWVLVAMTAVALVWFNTGLFGVRPTLISGPSMSPTLVAGDVVITRDVSAEAVKVGDMIRFRQEGLSVIHRVVEIQKDGNQIAFITRGDANNVNDPPVSASDLEGKIVLTVPKIGWVAVGVRKVIGWIL